MRYRVWQLWQALRCDPLTVETWAEVQRVLTPAEAELFARLPANDQWYSLRVLQLLQKAGHHEPALLKAALLHDVGKTHLNVTLVDRVVAVLGGLLWPGRTAVWGDGDGRGWQRPFVVSAQHPAWGAKMATNVGSDPLTIALIRRHQEKVLAAEDSCEERLLRALQWADNQS